VVKAREGRRVLRWLQSQWTRRRRYMTMPQGVIKKTGKGVEIGKICAFKPKLLSIET